MREEHWQTPNDQDNRQDFWADIPEAEDALPDMLPGVEELGTTALAKTLGGPAVLQGIEPFTPSIVQQPFNPNVEGEPQMDTMGPAHGDPLGSWTGVAEDVFETPTQDADDL